MVLVIYCGLVSGGRVCEANSDTCVAVRSERQKLLSIKKKNIGRGEKAGAGRDVYTGGGLILPDF